MFEIGFFDHPKLISTNTKYDSFKGPPKIKTIIIDVIKTLTFQISASLQRNILKGNDNSYKSFENIFLYVSGITEIINYEKVQ